MMVPLILLVLVSLLLGLLAWRTRVGHEKAGVAVMLNHDSLLLGLLLLAIFALGAFLAYVLLLYF